MIILPALLSGGFSRSFGAGIGVLFKRYKIDYAFVGEPGRIGIGSSHVLSFSYLFTSRPSLADSAGMDAPVAEESSDTGEIVEE